MKKDIQEKEKARIEEQSQLNHGIKDDDVDNDDGEEM